MSETEMPSTARIVVTCDTSPLGAAALDAAVSLARRLDVQLAGVFVENLNLLRMAELPFAREYALTSAAAQKVETGALVRALRQQANAAREALSRAAGQLSLPWSFQVVRGALLDSVLEMMTKSDLAVFGHTGQYAVIPDAGTAATQFRGRPADAIKKPILVLFDETPLADRALAAAGLLAQIHQTNLIVLLAGDDVSSLPRLRIRAAANMEGSRISMQFQNLISRKSPAIRQAAEINHAAALLWHGVETAEERKTAATLVDALKCPLVLVS